MAPSITPPSHRDEIAAALERLHADCTPFWESFTTEEFFRPIGTAWSPAENVRHLNKATRPVAQALKAPKLVLWFRFGKARRPSRTYQGVLTTYDEALAAGGGAGPFAPSPARESDLEAWRRKIMGHRDAVLRQLVEGIRGWRDKSLDRYQLPHPLMGNLTVREMLFFTLNHQLHHVEIVERHLRAAP